MMSLLVGAGTPLDRAVGDAGKAMFVLWLGGVAAMVLAGLLAFLDREDRGKIRDAVAGATAALGRTTGAPTPPPAVGMMNASLIAGTVEFVRALTGPAETFFRRSRVAVAMVIGGVLFIAGGLVPIFETALVANHCSGEVVGSSEAQEGEDGTPDVDDPAPAASPAADDAAVDPKKDKKTKGRDRGRGRTNRSVDAVAVGSDKQPQPRVFYPPGCFPGDDEDSPDGTPPSSG